MATPLHRQLYAGTVGNLQHESISDGSTTSVASAVIGVVAEGGRPFQPFWCGSLLKLAFKA